MQPNINSPYYVVFYSVTKEFQECKIIATEGKYFSRPNAWAFPKSSPYLDIFNFYITEVIQKGQWNAIVNRYMPRDQVCPDLSGKPIDFSSCVGAFAVLVSGFFVAFCIFVIEQMKRFLNKVPKPGILDTKNLDYKKMGRLELELSLENQRNIIKMMDVKLRLCQILLNKKKEADIFDYNMY